MSCKLPEAINTAYNNIIMLIIVIIILLSYIIIVNIESNLMVMIAMTGLLFRTETNPL